ncbi:MAG: VPLPA-CTERM sorting domain-containing protein [Chromatiales bacterium]|nr:VPLPA-CTERM sorting domain-containing protein [Chromatiales bacterium]
MQKKIAHKVKLAVAMASLLGLAAGVEAAPIQYNFVSGSATLSLTYSGGSLLAPGSSVPLTGGQVTVDTAASQVNSFQFDNAGPSNVNGANLLSGSVLTITNLSITPDVGYSTLSLTGSNPYNYLVGPVAVSGTYSVSGAFNLPPTAFSGSNPTLAGAFTLGGVTTLSLNGITLGTFAVATPFGPQNATLKADIIFNGVVPVPAAVWLLGSGLGLLGVMRRRLA